MRVLVCGDRNWVDPAPIRRELRKLKRASRKEPLVVIEGAARGADNIAGAIALSMGCEVEAYPAKWEEYGRAAGPIRNKEMLVKGKPDLVIAFHPNIEESKGTANMVSQAQKAGIPTEVYSA
jgi:YspA, cpYpsA-related SLOG family